MTRHAMCCLSGGDIACESWALEDHTYGDCEWGEVSAAGIFIWSYACANDRLIADEAWPGVQRELRDASGQVTLTGNLLLCKAR